jgi:hypothetical protein
MNRRDLLAKLALGAPALVTLRLLDKPLNYKPPDEFELRGWNIHWGGWRRMPNMDVLVGNWIAYGGKHDQWHLYSCWPGRCGSFVLGSIFDISTQKFQTLPNYRSSQADLAHYRNECLERLKRLVDKAGPPPLKEAVWLD